MKIVEDIFSESIEPLQPPPPVPHGLSVYLPEINFVFDASRLKTNSTTAVPEDKSSDPYSVPKTCTDGRYFIDEQCYTVSYNDVQPVEENCYALHTISTISSLSSSDPQGSEQCKMVLDDSTQNAQGSAIREVSSTPKRKHDQVLQQSSNTWSPLVSKDSVQKKRKLETVENVEKDCRSTKRLSEVKPFSNLPYNRRSLPGIKITLNSSDSSPYPKLSNSDLKRSKTFFSPPYSFSSPLLQKRSCASDQTPYDEDSSHRRKRLRTSLPSYNAQELRSLESKYGFIDSHCHLDFLFQRQYFSGTLAEYQEKHKETFPKSFQGCLAVFCNPFTFHKEYMWKKYLEEENVWGSFGCHPHNAKDYTDEIEKSLCLALKHSKVRALGEIGLDYSNRNDCLKHIQFDVFKRQLIIARKTKLPVVLHCREAHEDAMKIVKETLPTDYVIHLHCFTDTWEWAERWLAEFPNLRIGITNVVTFPSAESVHEVARNIPLNRLLLETDAPYFVPRAEGGKWSHPGMAIHVAAQIAALKNISIEKVLKAARKNTKSVYDI